MTRPAPAPLAGVPMDDMGSLARCCAEATLERVEGSVDDLGRLGALLCDAMAVLRRSFADALAPNTEAGGGECRRHLEAAMVALQSEDALLQMLDGVRARTLQTADALRYVVTPRRGERDPSRPGCVGRTAREEMASRLRLLVVALNAGIARSGRVEQTRAVAGSVDLF